MARKETPRVPVAVDFDLLTDPSLLLHALDETAKTVSRNSYGRKLRVREPGRAF
jgi:hypothetical protein